MGILDSVNLRLMRTMDDIADFKSWLGERREILGYDTETTGFSPERDRVRLAQFGDHQTGWAIPFDQFSGVVSEVIRTYDGEMLCHNLKFDARQTAYDLGITWPWHKFNDTMSMAHIINPLRPKGLKPLASMLVDPQAVAAQKMLSDAMHDNKWTWATVPWDFPLYWVYAAMDPVLTCHIWSHLNPQVPKDIYRLEMGATRVVANMEMKGAKVDLEYAEAKSLELMTWVDRANDWARDAYGISNTNSNAQLLKFFQDAGVVLLDKKTDGGSQSMDKDVLGAIAHPLAETVLKIREATKNVGPYFKNFLADADSDSRVHPNIWVAGTRTNRMSITNPALQTLPRKDPTVRDAFIPSTPGHVLITCDYDQVEARLAAHFSQDPGMIAAFRAADEGGGDFFVNLTREIYGDDTITKKDPRRQLTKNTIYGKLYGAGVEKMAQTARVPFEQMDAVVSAFDARYPGIRSLQQAINQQGLVRQMQERTMPYVVTPTGRKMFADDSKEYTLTNYLIQCHSAEILKRKLIELDAALDGDYMVLPVHDEVVFDVPADIAEDVARVIAETMQDRDSYAVPITASYDILTDRWGTKYRKG